MKTKIAIHTRHRKFRMYNPMLDVIMEHEYIKTYRVKIKRKVKWEK